MKKGMINTRTKSVSGKLEIGDIVAVKTTDNPLWPDGICFRFKVMTVDNNNVPGVHTLNFLTDDDRRLAGFNSMWLVVRENELDLN